MTPATPARRYHHGDLYNALVEAGCELAREGGPDAIVLREAARRVGVSPNAAYRHFTSLPDLVNAVAVRALTQLADSMRAEIKKVRSTGDERADAWRSFRAVGKAYVHFALREEGLFLTAFDRKGHLDEDSKAWADEVWVSPQVLVTEGLERLIELELLPATEMESARMLAWSSVHGLSLLLMGPLAQLSKRERAAMIDATLDQVGKGLFGGTFPV